MHRSGIVRHLALVFALAAVLPRAAFGWDSTGHQQIADIAWQHDLTLKARSEIAAILAAGEPSFVPSGPSASARRAAFRHSSTFSDFIKKHDSIGYGSIIPTMNGLWHPEADPLVSPREKDKCRSWHYYDTPIRFSGMTAPPVAESNGVNALNRALHELEGLEQMPTPDRHMQCWWLYWIVHLTGDLHQPLHCTSSYASGQADAGGNLFETGLPDPVHLQKKMVLHAYWDGGIGRARTREKVIMGVPNQVQAVTTRWSTNSALIPLSMDASDSAPASWVAKGAQNADTYVYTGISEGDVPTDDYASTQAALCKRLAVLGGFRLANLLNKILGQ